MLYAIPKAVKYVHVKLRRKCLTWVTLRPSQVAYFLSWPTLGSAIILTMMPSEDRMRQVRVVSLCLRDNHILLKLNAPLF